MTFTRTAPLAAIDAALNQAIECGVNPRYDAYGVVQAIQFQAADVEPLNPSEGFAVEIGAVDHRAWHLHVSHLEVTERDDDGQTYVDVDVPSDVAVTLREDGRGGRIFSFPAIATTAP